MNARPERHRPDGVSCPASELASGGWSPPGPFLLASPWPVVGQGSPIYTNTGRLTSRAPLVLWDGRGAAWGHDGGEKRIGCKIRDARKVRARRDARLERAPLLQHVT